ncbi:MAG: 2'-5' RNA ligase family protein [Bacteroidota bacterium]
MEETPPLIVTLRLDQPSQEYFNELRRKYFPAHVNYLEAHLSLFHHLPSSLDFVDEALDEFANRQPFDLGISGVKNMGNGAAFVIESPKLMMIHAALQQAFKGYLISQDRHRLWPHITVQNKVTAFKAKQTTELLSADFIPFPCKAMGFDTWFYLKGPWQHRKTFLFQKDHC